MLNPKPRKLMKRLEDGYGGASSGGTPQSTRTFKHIIVGIDGTWQAAFSDMFHSNVFRMNVALNYRDRTKRNPQVFIYSSGVGTLSPNTRWTAGAFGEGLDQLILQAYTNIVSNYVPGDKLYIFGFSRGAVAARALTGFISYSGLLKPNCASLIEHAWRYFTGQEPIINYAAQRDTVTHPNVKIEFLGVWDTVSGPFKKEELCQKYRFTSFKLDPSVKHGVQLLSLDESRGAFSPLLWTGKSHDRQVLEQIWLPGVHCDVGGGYSSAFLSTVSLLTMVDKLAENNKILSFDEEWIDRGLISILKGEDVIINDEWQNFPGWRRRRERIIECADGSNHCFHPIVEHLDGKRIKVRTSEYELSTICKIIEPEGSSAGREVFR